MLAVNMFSCCLVVTFTLAVISCASLKDLPTECFDATEIEDETRAFDNFNVPTSRANDLNLAKGWYRIIGKGGNGLKQGYPKPLTRGKDVEPNFCGTEYAGTLMGEHPTEEEGVVEMTVCFRERFCFFKLQKCECTKANTIKIYVRNCRKHYIYWLSPTANKQRYCTGNVGLKGAKVSNGSSTAVECGQHKIISSTTRIWNVVTQVTCDKNVGWYRYDDKSGLEIASTCTPNDKLVTRLGQPCGAEFRGWMIDQHPTLDEGRVQRRICFSYPDHCECDFFGNIAVRNCGSFYVYRLTKVPICAASYCTAPKGSTASVNDLSKPPVVKRKDICKIYNVVHDPDRFWSYTSPTVNKCDANLYGKYRFGSKYTPWSIKEGCNKSDMAVVTHRCGSKYQGFMEGVHPEVNEKYVERVICFQKTDVPCECQYSVVVGVQNCGGFYVYDFKGVPDCDSRFCMVANRSADITLDPGRPPLYELPVPGYTPVVAKKVDDDDDGNGGLVATTTVLSIIVFIVIILLILLIILIIVIVWPIYRERREKRPPRERNVSVEISEDSPLLNKPSTSNGQLPQDEKAQDFEESPIPPYPSVPPPSTPPQQTAPPLDEDSEIEMHKGPGSDDDLHTINEDTEYSEDGHDYDTLMKKEDVQKPNSYDNLHKDSAV